MAKYCKITAKVDETGMVEIAGLKVTEEEYNKSTRYAMQGNAAASIRTLLNTKNGKEVFHLGGSFKSRVENGKVKIQAWDAEAVKKFVGYFTKEYNLAEEAVKKHIKNWRDYMKRQAREAERATKRTSNKQQDFSKVNKRCEDCNIELTGEIGIDYFQKFDMDIFYCKKCQFN